MIFNNESEPFTREEMAQYLRDEREYYDGFSAGYNGEICSRNVYDNPEWVRGWEDGAVQRAEENDPEYFDDPEF